MDAAGFKREYLPIHAKLYRVAYRLMGNAQDAEDMVQDAYLKLWAKRNELNDISNAEAYCVALVKNLCFDALRSIRENEHECTPEIQVVSSDINLMGEVEQRDTVRHIRDLIAHLPCQQKKVMWLRDINDCTFDEIEETTGLNAVNIRVLLSRARKKVREQFNRILGNEGK